MAAAPKGWDRSGIMRGLRFYSPEASLSKERREIRGGFESEKKREAAFVFGRRRRKKKERGNGH
jgi:hypothetical protein